MPLVSAQVLVAEVGHLQAVAVAGQKAAEFAQLALVGANRVPAPVRFQLEPAQILVGGRMEVECHVEPSFPGILWAGTIGLAFVAWMSCASGLGEAQRSAVRCFPAC